jgi:hypothetical protein
MLWVWGLLVTGRKHRENWLYMMSADSLLKALDVIIPCNCGIKHLKFSFKIVLPTFQLHFLFVYQHFHLICLRTAVKSLSISWWSDCTIVGNCRSLQHFRAAYGTFISSSVAFVTNQIMSYRCCSKAWTSNVVAVDDNVVWPKLAKWSKCTYTNSVRLWTHF